MMSNENPQEKSLLDTIKTYFAPPIFENEERTRRASLLNSLLLTSILLTGLYFPLIPLTNDNPGPGMAVLGGIIITFVVMYAVFRQGVVQPVAITTLLVIWVLAAISAFFLDGVFSTSFLSLILIIIAAGMLISTRAAFFYTGATILTGIIIVTFENFNLLPEPLSPVTSSSYLTGLSLVFIMIVFFINILNNNISSTFNRTSEKQEALEESKDELEESKLNMEETISEQTKLLERRNNYLEAAAQVAQDAISSINPHQLLQRTVSLISEQFNYYHVGIFLIDESNEWAVLAAASSIGGQQMIARGHRLSVGKQGIVGFVTGIGQARISQDIVLDRIHSVTEELPDTRSEMALPLKARGEIIGALDIQESHPNAFTEDDVAILQILADQIALAINNTQLHLQAQESIEEIQRAYGEYNLQAWVDAQRGGTIPSYKYSPGGRGEAMKVDTDNLASETQSGKIEIPIRVRGQTVGNIDIVTGSDREEWSEDEKRLMNSLSEQLGVALDSARLFDETQQRAASERLISEVSAEFRESLDVESVLKTAVSKIREALNLPEVTIRLAESTEPSGTNGDTTTDSDDLSGQ
jgi:GAF domain-containing protein